MKIFFLFVVLVNIHEKKHYLSKERGAAPPGFVEPADVVFVVSQEKIKRF